MVSRRFWRDSARVRRASLLGTWGQIPLLRVTHVSPYLFLLGVHSTDINEGNQAYLGQFWMTLTPPAWGGSRPKNRDFARLRCAVVSSFGTLIQVCISERFAALPRSRVHISH